MMKRFANSSYKCPNCDDGFIRPSGKGVSDEVSGVVYPVEECDKCNTFAICNVPGEKPPMAMLSEALERKGIEMLPCEDS